MSYHISWGFLIKDHIDTTYWLTTKEWLFTIHSGTTPVFHKWVVRSIYTKEIGTWMKIPFLSPKIDIELDINALRSWLSIYRWFDEQTWTYLSYAYKFPTTSIDATNSVLKSFDLEERLRRWSFVGIDHSIDASYIESIHTIDQIVSLLLGLLLMYGKRTIENGVLVHAVIQLPLVGSIAQYEEILLGHLKSLADHALFAPHQYFTLRSGQGIQITIADHQLLQTRADRLGIRSVDRSNYRERLEQFVGDILPSNLILKFLHK